MSVQDLLQACALVTLKDKQHTKAQVIKQCARHMAEVFKMGDPHIITQNLCQREALGSTGLGEGVALPHATVQSAQNPCLGIFHLAPAVDFASIDDKKVDLLLVVLTGEDQARERSEILAILSRAVANKALRSQLRKAKTCEQITQLLLPASKSS